MFFYMLLYQCHKFQLLKEVVLLKFYFHGFLFEKVINLKFSLKMRFVLSILDLLILMNIFLCK